MIQQFCIKVQACFTVPLLIRQKETGLVTRVLSAMWNIVSDSHFRTFHHVKQLKLKWSLCLENTATLQWYFNDFCWVCKISTVRYENWVTWRLRFYLFPAKGTSTSILPSQESKNTTLHNVHPLRSSSFVTCPVPFEILFSVLSSLFFFFLCPSFGSFLTCQSCTLSPIVTK